MRLNGATIAFDLDGTLVETAPDLIGALNVVLGEQGLPAVAVAAARSLVGGGARALIARGFSAAGEPLDEAVLPGLVTRFIDVYRARIASESRPFPGVEAALDALAAEGAILCVCTNKPTALSLQLLDALDLSKRFAAVVGADSAPKPKPDARHVLHTIAEAGGAAARALMVGDSQTDAAAAQNAGVPCLLVPFGYTEIPVAELPSVGVFDHYDQLPALALRLLSSRLAPA